MAILIRDSRTFPVQNLPYLDTNLDTFFQKLLTLKRANCPQWTEESASDLGIQLLWLYAVMSQWLAAHMDRLKDNTYLLTTWDRQTVRCLVELIDYGLGEGAAASVNVIFALEAGYPEFTIPAGTKVATEETDMLPAIIFETAADQLVIIGLTEIDIVCLQGETITGEILGSSDGTTDQIFTFKRKAVVWQSEIVEVYEDGIWDTWTRVGNFVSSLAVDQHYRIQVDEDQNYSIVFGNGTNGKIPDRGNNNIRVTYRKGGGSEGNVPANTITELISSVPYVESVNNETDATGGTDRETLEHAKMFAPAAIKTLERALTTEDVENLAESFVSTAHGGVAIAKAFKIGGTSLSLMIVPRAGGNPSMALKSELQTYLNARKIICTSVQINDPIYVPVNVTVTIWTLPNHAASKVIAEVRRRLIAYLAANYQDAETGLYPHDFGRDVRLSDLYAVIENTAGVDYCRIALPVTDVLIDEFKIADVGDITLTANPTASDSAYIQTKSSVAKQLTKSQGFAS
jgi:hypothetical protein